MLATSNSTDRLGTTCAASASGSGSVAAIMLKTGMTERFSPGQSPSVYPFVQSASQAAVTLPPGVATRQPPAARSMRRAGLPAWMRAPAPCAARARPRA